MSKNINKTLKKEGEKNEYLVYISYISIIIDANSNISIDGYFINFTFSGK